MPFTSTILRASILAGLAFASPQQLNFDQIAAAPTVAVGPAVTGSADQTATLYTTFAVSPVTATASASVAARGLSRRANSVNSAYNAGFGTSGQSTTIASGALNWLSGGSTHNIQGNLNNYGSLYISQTDYLKSFPYAGGQTCNWAGHDANNGNLQNFAGGLIQVNDIGSASAPTYDWYLRSIANAGTLQFCGRGDTGGSTFQLYSDNDATNTGLISFEQSANNYGASFVWRNTVIGSTASSNLYNNGAFRLINVVYHNVQNVYGTGCWQLGKGSVLYLEDGTGLYQNPNVGPSFPSQSITFQDTTAVLHMDTAVYSKNSNFGPQLYGFSTGNAVEFYETIKSFSYSSTSGVLAVTMTSGNVANIKMGSGYDSTKFVNKRNPTKYNTAGYNAIFYNGAAPSQSAPATCSLTAAVCQNLSQYPPTSSTTSSSSVASTSTSKSSTTTSVVATTTSSSSVTSSSSTSSTVVSTTSSTSSSSPVSSTVVSISSSSAVVPSTTFVSSATSSALVTTTSTTNTAYTPYYAALSTTVSGNATVTTSSTTACPTTPENGTYCGFINPEDPCAPQPDGYGPVPTPDTVSAFYAYAPFHSMASAAPTAIASSQNGTSYQQTFRDLNASSSANSYISLITMQTYDPASCASACDSVSLCTAFNIFIERDPSLNPTNNDSTAPTIWGYNCPNPASMTSYKCTLWGSELTADTATNQGEWREQFQVVITGSNGYDRTNASTPDQPSSPATLTQAVNTATGTATSSVSSSASTSVASSATSTSTSSGTSSASTSTLSAPSGSVASTFGTSSTLTSATTSAPTSAATSSSPLDQSHPWKSGHNCGGKAINAPSYYIGSNFFPGPFNPQVCSDYALTQNSVNRAAAVKQGASSYTACQSFNAVYLHKNGKPHGTYCSLYTAAVDPSVYATYTGGKNSAGDTLTCKQSWTWELSVHDSGRC